MFIPMMELSVVESSKTSFTIGLSKASSTATTIGYTLGGTATKGIDYADLSGTVTIAAGQTDVIVDLGIVNDALFESDEEITVELVTISGQSAITIDDASKSATVTISDDDAAVASFSATSVIEGSDLVFSVSLDKINNTGQDIVLDLEDLTTGTATSGVDYDEISGAQIIIVNGAQSGSYTVSVSDDALLDENETINVKITSTANVSITEHTITATITDKANDQAEVKITGSATVGSTLSTVVADDDDGISNAISYQWYAGTDQIVGATESDYQLTRDELAKAISVKVTYVDDRGFSEDSTSSQTDDITELNVAPTGTVSITGTAIEGGTLSANTASIEDANGLGSFTYEWSDGTSVIGNSSTLKLTNAQVGKSISVSVSYTDGAGTAESLTSSTTAAVKALPEEESNKFVQPVRVTENSPDTTPQSTSTTKQTSASDNTPKAESRSTSSTDSLQISKGSFNNNPSSSSEVADPGQVFEPVTGKAQQNADKKTEEDESLNEETDVKGKTAKTTGENSEPTEKTLEATGENPEAKEEGGEAEESGAKDGDVTFMSDEAAFNELLALQNTPEQMTQQDLDSRVSLGDTLLGDFDCLSV
ncbi:MAG: hypothetical protein HRT88_18955 [Lentisphaeraceae bacterium]|nr:hypothetical protein [Lentisphaeraceae bacterium]